MLASLCAVWQPANVMPLLENVRTPLSSDQAVATAMQLGKRLRKKAVLAGECFGFIGNRMLEPYLHEAMFVVEEGATPQAVDAALTSFGMAMGPYAMSDLAGNDIGYNIRKEHPPKPERRYYAHIADELVEMGRLGQKTKAGWFDYAAGRKPVVDPIVEGMVAARQQAYAAGGGVGSGTTFTPEELLDRLLLPMVNEGFKILQEGVAQREVYAHATRLSNLSDHYGYGGALCSDVYSVRVSCLVCGAGGSRT